MKQNYPRILAGLCASFALLITAAVASAADATTTALMVVAQGSRNTNWNNRVIQSVEKLDWAGPKAAGFLTSPSPEHELKHAAAQLDQPSVKRIVVVPLLVSSYSAHYEEIRYYVGQRPDLPHADEEEGDHAKAEPLKTKAPLVLTTAMDSHPLGSRILADNLKPLLKEAGKQSVVLVAHGPNEDGENEHWLKHLNARAQRLTKELGLRRVEAVTLRDDAPKPIRDAATAQLRATVQKAGTDSQVLVLPVLISVGHIQKEIQQRLEGLKFTMVEGGLANHPLAAEWVRQQTVQSVPAKTTASLP